MRVVVGERVGGPEVLTIAEREAPRPGPGQVVVDVAAAGVNYMDIYQREGVGNYLEVLSAETQLLQQQSLEADLKTRGLTLSINLVRALGGGFDPAQVAANESK